MVFAWCRVAHLVSNQFINWLSGKYDNVTFEILHTFVLYRCDSWRPFNWNVEVRRLTKKLLQHYCSITSFTFEFKFLHRYSRRDTGEVPKKSINSNTIRPLCQQLIFIIHITNFHHVSLTVLHEIFITEDYQKLSMYSCT